MCALHICRQRRITYGCNSFKACLFLVSISEELFRLKINKWSAERTFGFEETVFLGTASTIQKQPEGSVIT